jgi:hypothetical protein
MLAMFWGDDFPGVAHRARCRRREAGDGAKERGLARSVGTDQAEDLARVDIEGRVAKRPEWTISLGKSLDADVDRPIQRGEEMSGAASGGGALIGR